MKATDYTKPPLPSCCRCFSLVRSMVFLPRPSLLDSCSSTLTMSCVRGSHSLSGPIVSWKAIKKPLIRNTIPSALTIASVGSSS